MLPAFLLQGVLLWIPLALYPPLAEQLKQRGGARYYLEVPCLKFFTSFTGDMLFFASLTLLPRQLMSGSART